MKQRNNKMLLNALAVILTVVVFLVVWKILLPSYAKNKSEEQKLNSELSDAQAEVSSIETAKSDLSSITDTVNQLLVAVPADTDAPNLISELEAISTKNSLVLPSINIVSAGTTTATAAPKVSAGTPVTVNFSVTGPFANISAFTDALETSIIFMHIKSITMSSANANSVSASYSIETYTRAEPSVVGAQ
jgi:Tfp pilus assembly protein PilO